MSVRGRSCQVLAIIQPSSGLSWYGSKSDLRGGSASSISPSPSSSPSWLFSGRYVKNYFSPCVFASRRWVHPKLQQSIPFDIIISKWSNKMWSVAGCYCYVWDEYDEPDDILMWAPLWAKEESNALGHLKNWSDVDGILILFYIMLLSLHINM